MGVFLIIFGALALIFSCVDFSTSAKVTPFLSNPNYRTVARPYAENNLAATWHENSIWPSLGKGFWIGLLMIGTGILSIISHYDGSYISLFVLNVLAWINLIFSLFSILTAILAIQPYPYNNLTLRVKKLIFFEDIFFLVTLLNFLFPFFK